MAKLFDYENPVWRFMGKVTDLCFVTILWAAASIPIITIGASTTALYSVVLKMAENQEGYLWSGFWKAFRENWKQSTAIWLIMAVLGIFFAADLFWYSRIPTPAGIVIFWTFFVLAILYFFLLTMIFPLAARLDTTIKNLFLMTFMVTLKNFSWVLLMAVTSVCVFAIGILVFWPVLFIGMGVTAFIHGKILVHVVFPKYQWNENK